MRLVFIFGAVLFIFFKSASVEIFDEYNEEIAQVLADFASIAYCRRVEPWTCKTCQKYPGVNPTQIIHEELGAFVAHEASLNSVIVSFRGTQPASLPDWVDDIKFKMVDYGHCEGCGVHGGFYEAHKSLYNDIRKALTVYLNRHPNALVAFTGHSLGGALAVLAAAEFSLEYPDKNNILLYTFGQPRVGNKAFSALVQSLFGARCARVTHYKDPVPHLPFKYLGYMASNFLPFKSVHFSRERIGHSFPPAAIQNSRVLTEAQKYNLPKPNEYWKFHHQEVEIFFPTEKFEHNHITCIGGENDTCSARYFFNLMYVDDHWHYLNADFFQATFWCDSD